MLFRSDFSAKQIPTENVFWNRASIIIKSTDLKSIKEEIKINFGSSQFAVEPVFDSVGNTSVGSLESSFFDYNSIKNNKNFSFQVVYNGSNQIKMVPIGKTTQIKMTSDWPSPSFDGAFIPSSKTISKLGFAASWKILHFNRAFSQSYFNALPDLSSQSLSVDFITPIDEYMQNERASKYGFLVIGLTFLIFFLIQTISKINIHIFQYLMIGLSLVLFYTLLISITEHSSFSFAYAISGLSVVVLITLFSFSIVHSKKFSLLIAASLASLYTFIYVIIQLED